MRAAVADGMAKEMVGCWESRVADSSSFEIFKSQIAFFAIATDHLFKDEDRLQFEFYLYKQSHIYKSTHADAPSRVVGSRP